MTGLCNRHRRGLAYPGRAGGAGRTGLALTALLCVRNAHAEDAAPKPLETKQESPIRIERDALYEQDSLDSARASVAEHAIARKEDFELKRAQHQRQMEKLQGQPEDSNARKLLGRRVFFPSLVGVGSGQGGLGFFGPSLLAFSASETASSIAVRPRLDVKFDSGLTVGGNVFFANQTVEVRFISNGTLLATSTNRSTIISVQPRIGYMLPIGQSGLLLWPKANIYAEYTLMKMVQTSPSQGAVEQLTPVTSFGGGGDVSLLLPLSSRAYLDLTPSFTVTKSWVHAESEDTRFSGGLAVGLGVAF
jgi:hypothetical protein